MAPAPRGSASGQKFPCSQCDKTFSRKEYMARHFRSKHSKEKPFECEYCSHGFSRSDLLRRHYKTCSEAKALGVSGPPPGSEKPQSAASSSSRPKSKRTRSTSETSPEPPSHSESPAAGTRDADDDETMLPTPPQFLVASTSDAPSPPEHTRPDLRLHPPPLKTESSYHESINSQYRAGEQSAIVNHSPYYSIPHPSQLQYGPGPPYNPYSQYYHPYPPPHSSYPRHAPPYSNSPPSVEPPTAGPSTSDSVAAESLTHYLRQHHESLHHQPQPNPLPPIAQPPSAAAAHQPLPELSPDPSSSSAFRPGTATNDTLAPGLSGTGSFSADEVLASEVLRDLMRSPMSVVRPGMSRGDSGESATGTGTGSVVATRKLEVNPAEGGGGEAGGRSVPSQRKGKENAPTNAVSLGNHQTDWGLMGGINGFGSSKVNTPIEESPAAVALAEYFNKGGVGGISALDLGFPTEPSLFEDWLLNPAPSPFMDDADRRYEISEQMFHLAYLYPWHVPPIKKLSQYAKRAAETMLPSIPVFHAASLAVTEMAPHGAFALTVVGGAYEAEGQSFSNEMLVEKRVFLIRGFIDASKTWEDRFASLQSLLLYQLLGFFHVDEQQRLLAQQFHTSLIYMLKQLDVPRKVRETTVSYPPPDASQDVIERAWKEWVKVETWKRVTFIVFLTDLEHSIATGAPQFVQLSDMDLDLPASEFAWSAENATEWHIRSPSCRSHPPVSFLAAVRALLAQNVEPFSEHSIVLAELSRLSSFPLLILSRMLSYMDKKCEEALRQVDPFKPLLGGLGMASSREQENRTMLVRIRNGREILRRLPGGMARGGGERWFQDTMPTAFGGAPRRESSTSGTSDSYFSSSSSAGGSTKSTTKTSSPDTSDSALNTPPQQAADSYDTFLSELDHEDTYGRDADAYRPYHGAGGAWPGETFAQAQDRLRDLREAKVDLVHSLIPPSDLPVPY
ncbi:hypothetical protein JCM11491_002991 [Sporobolomyces phaffii]